MLNAIVHRDYSASSSTLISIFDDRIEFVTIGGLVCGISHDDIILGVSALRNQHLANVFYRLKLIEAYGTGIMKINECYADQKIKPKIEVSNNAFKITLPNVNNVEVMENADRKQIPVVVLSESEREEKVLSLFETKEAIARKDVETALGVSQCTAGLLLRKVVKNNLLGKEGKGRNLQYRRK